MEHASHLLNSPVDVSGDFIDPANLLFFADRLESFDAGSGRGELVYRAQVLNPIRSFNTTRAVPAPAPRFFSPEEYTGEPALPFAIEFVSPRTLRVRLRTRPGGFHGGRSPMLAEGQPARDPSWTYEQRENGHCYSSPHGRLEIEEAPWRLALFDADGKVLTQTHHAEDSRLTYIPLMPFSFVRRASDDAQRVAASFNLAPDERIYGCGESFASFNKRGSKVVLCTTDPNGVETERMYKPIPFFMSNRGYGMFIHTSTPITCDFGRAYSGLNTVMTGDDELDLFIFLGSAREILDAYTTLTGKAAMPPLWSFGLWMSRITYDSEEQVREVAGKLREHRIPSDVIHLDTGWFEKDWCCDYEFSTSRFDDPVQMFQDLRKDGFRVSLWQLPYFIPGNRLYPEIMERGLHVKDEQGGSPLDDAVLDFSNPDTVAWYQEKIRGLLEQGASAIKVDFGEAAPYTGHYASGRTGFYEHNLYPLRYNKTVADVTLETTGENIIWARSTWAGSQRYPLHWGGDPAPTDSAMAATLRGGLSIGLSGFSFWSHDIGGFVRRTPEGLLRRWAAFGMFTSHSRRHGAPPTEPWAYSRETLDVFRAATEMRYRLMPYLYAQAKDSSERGLPMLRALFIDYPDDPGSWLVDDQYLFGRDLLVAPLLEETTERAVYLPPGTWIDYQAQQAYEGGWHTMAAGAVPIVVLVRAGAALPHIALAPSTNAMDWSNLELVVYPAGTRRTEGLLCLPGDESLHTVEVEEADGRYALVANPLEGRTNLSAMPFTNWRTDSP